MKAVIVDAFHAFPKPNCAVFGFTARQSHKTSRISKKKESNLDSSEISFAAYIVENFVSNLFYYNPSSTLSFLPSYKSIIKGGEKEKSAILRGWKTACNCTLN